MEIKIETKYNLEENVFFIEGNHIKNAYIKEVNITSRITRGSFQKAVFSHTVSYGLRRYYNINSKLLEKSEEELFATKEELYKSME